MEIEPTENVPEKVSGIFKSYRKMHFIMYFNATNAFNFNKKLSNCIRY